MKDFRYADGYRELTERFEALRGRIAEKEQWDLECVLPTNGATGALDAVFSNIALQSYQRREQPTALVALPEYFDAMRQLNFLGYQMIEVKGENFAYPVEKIVDEIAKSKPALYYISRPRNPTGELIGSYVLDELLATAEKTCIVLDRSLVHPDDKYTNKALREKWGDKNIVIIESFSKKVGLIRERAGYLLTMNKKAREHIHPYAHAPSYDTMLTAIKATEGNTHREEQGERFKASDKLLSAWKNDQAEYHSSLSDFALIKLFTLSGEACRKALDGKGFRVRSGEQLYMEDTVIRIDMGKPENLPEFLEALNAVLSEVVE